MGRIAFILHVVGSRQGLQTQSGPVSTWLEVRVGWNVAHQQTTRSVLSAPLWRRTLRLQLAAGGHGQQYALPNPVHEQVHRYDVRRVCLILPDVLVVLVFSRIAPPHRSQVQKITKTTLYINYYQSQKAELQNKIQIDGAGYRNGERGDLGDHKLILCKVGRMEAVEDGGQ